MKYYILIISFIISSNLFCQVSDSCKNGVGTFNAPEIKVIDYERIDFALRKSLTEEEYRGLGNGIIVISVKIDTSGKVCDVLSFDYKGVKLSKLNEEIFKLNIIKYIKFSFPDFYKGLVEVNTSVVFKIPQ